MASPLNAALAALVATVLWTSLGYALARHLLPRALAAGASPVLGWAVHSAVTLPLFTLIGFTSSAVVTVAALCVIAAVLSFRFTASGDDEAAVMIPPWTFAAAALLALAPAVAIVPKFSGGAVHLADPIFDHSKIAIIDAIGRQGLPPVDPVFGAAGGYGQFFYYYLWHYSAAELAVTLRVSGWEADIALTWFTAFASLCLLMGVAVWLGKKPGAAIWVVLLAAATSLRVTLSWIFGSWTLEPFLDGPTGFAGWLFQSAWAPQHVMSAACVVLAMLLIARYAIRRSVALLVTLILIVVAGFESSTYVGGVTFAVAALAAAPLLIAMIRPAEPPAVFGWHGGCGSARGHPCAAIPRQSAPGRGAAQRWRDYRASDTLRCLARCFRKGCGAPWTGRLTGSFCCRSNSLLLTWPVRLRLP